MGFKRKYLDGVFGLAVMGGMVGGIIGVIQDLNEVYQKKEMAVVEYVHPTKYFPVRIISNNPHLDKGILNGSLVGASVGLAGLLIGSLLPSDWIEDSSDTKLRKL